MPAVWILDVSCLDSRICVYYRSWNLGIQPSPCTDCRCSGNEAKAVPNVSIMDLHTDCSVPDPCSQVVGLHTCCEHASMRTGKHLIQNHRLHKNVTVETECAFRTPKAARSAAPPEAKRARSARFAPPSRLKLPRFARPVKQKQGTNDLKPQCSDLRNILLTGFVSSEATAHFSLVFQ